jgi:hypothetical protein
MVGIRHRASNYLSHATDSAKNLIEKVQDYMAYARENPTQAREEITDFVRQNFQQTYERVEASVAPTVKSWWKEYGGVATFSIFLGGVFFVLCEMAVHNDPALKWQSQTIGSHLIYFGIPSIAIPMGLVGSKYLLNKVSPQSRLFQKEHTTPQNG